MEGIIDPSHLAETGRKAPVPITLAEREGRRCSWDGLPERFCTDRCRCRCVRSDGGGFSEVLALLGSPKRIGSDVTKTEHLYALDGERAYSQGAGEVSDRMATASD